MTIEVIDGRPVGYLTVQEYAKKHFVSPGCIRHQVFFGKIEPLKIGYEVWISEETPYPKDRRLKENR